MRQPRYGKDRTQISLAFKDNHIPEALYRLLEALEAILPRVETLIIDDASARLPGWFFYCVIKQLRGVAPRAYYVPFGNQAQKREGAIWERLQRLSQAQLLPSPALLITEHIRSGDGLNTAFTLLDKLNIRVPYCYCLYGSLYR